MANEKTENETLKIMPTTSNCNCKNSVFCDLFYADENADKNLLEFVNTLLGTNYESADCLEKMRIEEYYDHPYKDDVVVLVDDKKLLIVERRTDDNPNVPLNLFSYYMQIVESLARENSHHRGTVGKLPAPIFVVLYNGEIDISAQSEMTLSDAFMSASIVPSMNVSVQQININYDKSHELLRKQPFESTVCSLMRLENTVQTGMICRKQFATASAKEFLKNI